MKNFYFEQKILGFCRTVLLWTLFFLLTHNSLQAQTFNLSQIESGEFPILRTTYDARDANNYNYFSVTPKDFQIIDNGELIDPKYITNACEPKMPSSIVVMMDFSNSTLDYDLSQWMSSGLQKFFQEFEILPGSGVALEQFSGTAQVLQDFTTDTIPLNYMASHPVKVGGSTNYNEAFKLAFEMLANRPVQYPKFLIMLSDGKHKFPGTPLDVDFIVSGLLKQNITLFGITLQNNSQSDLTTLVTASGGYGYFAPDNTYMSDIFHAIADILNQKGGCELSWIEPTKICRYADNKHTVSIKFLRNNITAYRTYTVPDNFTNYINVATDRNIYDFGTPSKGEPSFRTILLMPQDTDLTIHNFSINPPTTGFTIADWGDNTGNQPGGDVNVKKGDTLKVILKYIGNGDPLLNQAALQLTAEPCDESILLSAGVKNITIIKPVEGDRFTTCQDVDIVWTGIDLDNPVNLFYSIDSGKTWISIVENIKGGEYKWKVPSEGSYMIKAALSVYPEIKWINNYGNIDKNESYCVSNDSTGNVYISGTFTGDIPIGSTTISSKGGTDAFIAKFDPNGTPLWAQTLGSYNNNDNGNAVAADKFNYVVMTGNTYRGFDYSLPFYNNMLDGKSYLFLSRYFGNNGSNTSYVVLGADPDNNNIQLYPKQISIVRPNNLDYSIYIKGKYTGSYYKKTPNQTFQLPYSMSQNDFIAEFNSNLQLVSLTADMIPWLHFNSDESFDRNNVRYKTGNYFSDTTIYAKSLSNRGGSDFYLYRSDPVKNADIAYSKVFYADKPHVKFKSGNYFLGEFPAMSTNTIIMKSELINYGSTDVILNELTLDGVMKNDFSLVGNYTNIKIAAGDSIDIKIKFRPGDYGERNCPLTANIDCADPAIVLLKGTGTCESDAVALKYLGSLKIFDSKTDTIRCAIQNLTSKELIMSPRIEGDAKDDYKMEILGIPDDGYTNIVLPGNTCFDIAVTFSPSANGQRSAYINYYLPSNCNDNHTELSGNGTVPNLGISSYDWGRRRINGSYAGKITIYNNTPLDYNLTDLTMVNPNQSGFSFVKPSLPYNIQANKSLDIEFTFNPDDEIDYHEQIKAIIENKPDPLIGDLTGTGYLPKLEIETSCGNAVVVGDTSYAVLTLKNPSLSSPLNIDKILLSDTDSEYFIEGNPQLNGLILDTNSSMAFNLIYIPQKTGDGECVFDVFADNYDAAFEDKWKDNSTSLNCGGLDLDFTNPLTFGPLIPCGNSFLPVIVRNLSKIHDLTIFVSKAQFKSSNSEFSLTSNKDIVIPALDADTLLVKFSPQLPGYISDTLSIPNSYNIPININLEAESILMTPFTTELSYNVTPGQEFTFPLNLTLDKTVPDSITSISIYLNYKNSAISLKSGSFTDLLTRDLKPGEYWNWNTPVYNFGSIYLEGTGKLLTSFEKSLYSVNFITLLTPDSVSDITAKIDYNCFNTEQKISEVHIDPICFQGYRYIQASNVLFGLNNVSPTPASMTADIEFGVGFDAQTNLSIYNILGNLEITLVNGEMKTGSYSTTLDCSKLASGIYYIKFNSGPYSETKQLVIKK